MALQREEQTIGKSCVSSRSFANEGSFHGRRDAKRNLKMHETALSQEVSFGGRCVSQMDSLRGNNNRGKKVRSGVTGDEQLIESFPRFLGNFERLERKEQTPDNEGIVR